MAIFETTHADYRKVLFRGEPWLLLDRDAYERFLKTDYLGLGSVSQSSRELDAIAAVFDIEGFTSFCNRRDPELRVPQFTSNFLDWIIAAIRSGFIDERTTQGVALYAKLPRLIKFTGDGVLVLWDCSLMNSIDMRNVIACSDDIRIAYSSTFYPNITRMVSDAPPVLRCGVARGKVYTIGNGTDCVGGCINMASRIQKLPGITFAFDVLGFDLAEPGTARFFSEELEMKLVDVRGFKERPKVGLLKREFDSLNLEDRSHYY